MSFGGVRVRWRPKRSGSRAPASPGPNVDPDRALGPGPKCAGGWAVESLAGLLAPMYPHPHARLLLRAAGDKDQK